MRPPSPGRPLSPLVRIVIHASPLFTGSVKPPEKVAPGGSAMVSPACAPLIACWRSPPGGTGIVEAFEVAAISNTPTDTTVVSRTLPLMVGGSLVARIRPGDSSRFQASIIVCTADEVEYGRALA